MANRQAEVTFGVLGPSEVAIEGATLELGSPQLRVVLAALLVDANAVVSVDRLIQALWGDAPPASASSSVQKLVYRLRSLLGAAADDVLVTRPTGYAVHVAPECFDAAQFEGLVAEGQEARRRGDAAEAARLLDVALGLWRGPAFGEFAFSEFARAEAARLEELRWVAIEERVEARLTLGAHEELVGELEVLVGESGFRERLWGELMLALYRSGRQAEALRAYARVRSLLGEELGIEPGAALRGLEEAMLLQKPDLDWAPAAASAPPLQVPRDDLRDRTPAPSGTVTFVFTDLEGSTRLWEEHPDTMQAALARHDEILRTAVEQHDGIVVKTTGDGVHAAFATARDALQAAFEAQRALVAEQWASTGTLQVRIGVHTGSAEYRDGDYYGTAVNRAARVMAAAHGGQVVVSLATEELVRDSLPDDVTLIDLGEHRLRGLARPERIFQLAHAELLREFPPLQSLDAFPGNLPPQVNSFVGREEELAAAARALGESRLLTLTGVGGVGKTRLAIQIAAEVIPDFPDGAWLCELAVASDPDVMLQVVAIALGVQVRGGVPIESLIIDFLRTKQLLLVLDNCEHLLDAAARLADTVLRDAPGVRILATSREGLAVEGEHMRALRSLPLPEPADDFEMVVHSDAGRLFMDRARAVDPAFTVDTSTGAAVGELCRRLDGVPLAIELAAARIVAMGPAEIVAHLDERFRLLTGGRRAAVERHQTLRATVDWSFSLCSPIEQLVFARLGVFAGTFDAGAAEAVAAGDGVDGWDVIDALASLVAKSMVVGDRAPDGSTRYSMLETLRAYARERLDETDDADQWRRRHAEHYARFAEQAGPGLEGPDEFVWRDRMRAELDNLRAAIGWALDSTPTADAQLGLRIVAALAYAAVSDMTAGVSTWTERAVLRADETTPGRRTAILGTAAIQAIIVGDQDRARTLALDALRDGLPPDCPVPAPAYTALASTELNDGRPDKALRVMQQGVRDLEATGGYDAYQGTAFHSPLAVFLTYSGDIPAARAEADEALRQARQVGNPTAISGAQWALGKTLLRADPPAALAAYEAYIVLVRSGAKSSNLGWALGDVGWLKARAGDRVGALRAARDGIRHDQRSGNRTMLAGTLNRTKYALVELGHTEPAAVIAGAETDGALVPWDVTGAADELQDHEHALDVLRASLGSDGFEQASALGASMTYDEIVEYTLNEVERLLAEGSEQTGAFGDRSVEF